MRIVHFGTSITPVLSDKGGALQRRTLEMARLQAQDGHEVVVLSPGSADRSFPHEGFEMIELRLHTRRPVRDYEFMVRARQALAKRRVFDVLHVHGAPHSARMLGVRARVSVQSVDFFRYRGTQYEVGRRAYVRSLRRFNLILPVSDYCRDEFLHFYPELTSRTVKLPNGVASERFRPDPEAGIGARQALGLPSGPLVLYVGRVCEQKGSDLLSGLTVALTERGLQANVVAAGPPDMFGRSGTTPLVSQLEDAGVIVTGAVDECLLPGLMNAADVFVLPTRRDEMFGMAALEAASCGIPIVASRLGGIPEAVGEGGALFRVGDIEEFTEAVAALLNRPDDRADLGARARHHALTYTWRSIVDQAEDIYRRALDGRP